MRFVPNRALLIVAAAVILPALTLMVRSGGGVGAGLVIAAMIALAAVDLLLSRRRLEGLRLSVDPLLRGTVGGELTMVLRFKNGATEIPYLRAGLELPEQFRASDGPIVGAKSTFGAATMRRLELVVTPLQRGRYEVDACHIETASAWRLWVVRRRLPIEIEMRIYPDLRSERRRLSALFLHRGNDGVHAMRQMGKGREFEQLREYQPGDDYGDIDWKATSRRGLPVTRTFQIERTQEVYVVVDHSRLSAREIRLPVDDELPGGEEFWNAGSGESDSTGEKR